MGDNLKKVYLLVIVFLTLGLASCDKKSKHKDLNDLTEYVESLDSYELKAVLAIKRQEKTVNMNVDVNYLKPAFYKVSFTNESGNEQIVVKNTSGVYVLTPSLNKEFRFDSEWPLNSSHAYILEAIMKDIENDGASTFIIENDIMQIESKISKTNSDVVKMKFYYDLVNNKPIKTVFLNPQNEEKISVTFSEFTANKALKEDVFNNKLIMDEKTSLEGVEPTIPTILLTVGHIIDGTTLTSQQTSDSMVILCYTGDKNYTIVASVATTYFPSVTMFEFDELEVMSDGVIMFNDYGGMYYHDGLEVAIYSNELTVNEILSIAETLVFE